MRPLLRLASFRCGVCFCLVLGCPFFAMLLLCVGDLDEEPIRSVTHCVSKPVAGGVVPEQGPRDDEERESRRTT